MFFTAPGLTPIKPSQQLVEIKHDVFERLFICFRSAAESHDARCCLHCLRWKDGKPNFTIIYNNNIIYKSKNNTKSDPHKKIWTIKSHDKRIITAMKLIYNSFIVNLPMFSGLVNWKAKLISQLWVRSRCEDSSETDVLMDHLDALLHIFLIIPRIYNLKLLSNFLI